MIDLTILIIGHAPDRNHEFLVELHINGPFNGTNALPFNANKLRIETILRGDTKKNEENKKKKKKSTLIHFIRAFTFIERRYPQIFVCVFVSFVCRHCKFVIVRSNTFCCCLFSFICFASPNCKFTRFSLIHFRSNQFQSNLSLSLIALFCPDFYLHFWLCRMTFSMNNWTMMCFAAQKWKIFSRKKNKIVFCFDKITHTNRWC